MENTKQIPIELVLAGKLAIAAREVITSDVKNLSKRIEDMEFALNNYDMKIIELMRENELKKEILNQRNGKI